MVCGISLFLTIAIALLSEASGFIFQHPSSFHKRSANRFSLAMSNSYSGGANSFVKYQGLGNDFILVDNRGASEPLYTPDQAIKLCNRNFGIGGDGLIFAMPGTNECQYTMRIYNSDGSEPEMCGNGIRCMAKFLELLEDKPGAEHEYTIWTGAGVITPKITADGSITVDMGEPILTPEQVPTTLQATDSSGLPTGSGPAAVDASMVVDGITYQTTAVSMGNPHSIMFVDDLESMSPPFGTIGPQVESSVAFFPERVNAEFVQVLDRGHVRMKVWERGAGPTLACGTGACAVVVAGVLTGRTDRQCRVSLPGGDLEILWNEADNKLYMTGPAKAVFSGTIEADI